MPKKVTVEAHARLHITLLDMNGSLGRVDGGVGAIISNPVVRVSAEQSDTEKIDEEARVFAERFFSVFGRTKVKIEVVERYEPHVGLGSTTQLALSVAKALSELCSLKVSVHELARIMKRGGTSGIGVAGFEGGGSFIVDGGHKFGKDGKTTFSSSDYSQVEPAQAILKASFPPDLRFVVAKPLHAKKIHSELELELFQRFCPIPEWEVEKLCRIVLVKMIPSVIEGDIEGFGEAVNMVQDIAFKKREIESQGEAVKSLMQLGLKLGASGAGMSSFGPSVYFVLSSEKKATRFKEDLLAYTQSVFVAKPWEKGAQIKTQT